ncbi:MAG: peptidoglycan DD-metalloendopeptidase family protein [Asticcacaulis sp.]
MRRARFFSRLKPVVALCLMGLCVSGAQGQVVLSKQAQAELDTIQAELRANERKSEQKRRSARQIAREMEGLRREIINIGQKQGASEKRAAVYRARLETLNAHEADLTRRLGTMRNKQARLLSALQVYSRNPPPTIFVSSRKANDAVLAAIILKEVTPELKKSADALSEQNRNLLAVRREAALQSEALFISESDVAEQQAQLEALLAERGRLEDQLLSEADAFEVRNLELEARARVLRGQTPLKGLLGTQKNKSLNLVVPVVGEKLAGYGETVDGRVIRGVRLKAAAGAQVRSPAEGEVEYAGPLEGYGQVIIVHVGGDYRVIMTGIGRVYVEAGKTVGANEPLGRLPNLSEKPQSFYFELRKSDRPVNPATGFDLSKL